MSSTPVLTHPSGAPPSMVIPSKPHIILLSSPGYGHLIPVLNLATRLVTRHNVSVTVFAFSTSSVPSSHHPALFDLVLLPYPTITFPPETHIVSRLVIIVRHSLPSLRDSIAAMKTPPTALVVDLFSTEAIKIADELKILKFVFFATNAWYLAATVLNSYIKGKISPVETVEIPGCEPVRPWTLSDLMYNDCPGNKEYKRIGREISTADGVLVNTWDDLERRTLGSFRSKENMGKFINGPVWGVGPLVKGFEEACSGSWAVEWLDRQPVESVLYISFGSGGTFTTWQTAEMAWALDTRRQRFVWVLRPPSDHDTTASLYFDHKGDQERDRISSYLPAGFLDRTHDTGIVVPMWAPQDEILAHKAVGGFLSHCGWNSTLESLVNGVPLIGWPLYAEQDVNATMLAYHLGVAVRPDVSPSRTPVGREEIARMIRKVMVEEDGVAMRLKAKELQRSGEKALSEGGTSYEALSMFVKECEVNYFRKFHLVTECVQLKRTG